MVFLLEIINIFKNINDFLFVIYKEREKLNIYT